MAAVGSLPDRQVARATHLPGWTVGHVLTHVAHNADSHRRRAEAAVTGDVIDRYPGGPKGRAADIGAGPRLPEGAVLPSRGALDDREELAWLYGRVRRDDLAELAPWQ
jgi:maleylpyruvate isomerase